MLETDIYLYEEGKAKCTDCFEIKDMDELYGSLNKVHDYDNKWMNDLFTEDDWLCDPCLNNRFKKHKEEINNEIARQDT